jgi:putative peptidoglycan lipid II flippase
MWWLHGGAAGADAYRRHSRSVGEPETFMTSARDRSRFAAIFAGGTMLSRVFGLVRDVSMTYFIPVAAFDAFIVAFRLPNTFRELIGEGASNAAFVPVLSEAHEKKSQEEFRRLVAAGFGAMFVLLLGLTAFGVLIMPRLLGGLEWVSIFTGTAPVPPDEIQSLTRLSMWMFPYLFFICLAVYCAAPLYTLNRYATPSWTPVLLNISLILACWLGRDWFTDPAYALAVGVWVGGIAQLLAVYIAMGRIAGVWLPSAEIFHPGIRRMFYLVIPVIFGQAAGEVNKLVDTFFARGLGEDGVVRGLFLANRLIQLPLAIFGIATSIAILPSISKAAARADLEEVRTTLMEGFRQTYFLLLPACFGLLVLAEPIVRLFFERGEFSAEGTAVTTNALILYGLGLIAFGWVKVGVSGFYAVQNTRTPVVIASLCMLLNILMNMALVGILGYRGLALSTSVAFGINALFLYLLLSHRFGRMWDASFVGALGRMTVAGALMAVVVWGVRVYVGGWAADGVWLVTFLQVLVPISIGVIVYAGLSKALAIEEWDRFESLLRRKAR